MWRIEVSLNLYFVRREGTVTFPSSFPKCSTLDAHEHYYYLALRSLNGNPSVYLSILKTEGNKLLCFFRGRFHRGHLLWAEFTWQLIILWSHL